MQRVWRPVRWLSGKLLFFTALLLTTVMLIRLPALMVYGPPAAGQTRPRPHLEIWPWLRAVWLSLTDLLKGHLVPAVTERQQIRFWDQTVRSVWPELTTTLELAGMALVFGIVLGLTFGWLMSRLGPTRLRRPAWGTTTLIGSIPDLLLATAFDLALVLLGRVLGFRPYAPDL
ncbi:MAG TPA: hypothetical protein VNT01_02405, partial [Symbiobacteriaceae bacterium]|nr:hypothetical protein [Symbiobacteriaceae bacterium]